VGGFKTGRRLELVTYFFDKARIKIVC
jgi:hypothetical protein